nr:hypothetical protein [Halomicrobium katesii]
MADNKSGRDEQADNADRRQRERDILTALERNDETEPPVDERALGELETELDTLSFPATAREVVEAVGDRPSSRTRTSTRSRSSSQRPIRRSSTSRRPSGPASSVRPSPRR